MHIEQLDNDPKKLYRLSSSSHAPAFGRSRTISLIEKDESHKKAKKSFKADDTANIRKKATKDDTADDTAGKKPRKKERLITGPGSRCRGLRKGEDIEMKDINLTRPAKKNTGREIQQLLVHCTLELIRCLCKALLSITIPLLKLWNMADAIQRPWITLSDLLSH
ncbi:hypothetical protein LZ554_001976 [Drepanopeziza brunnea f. sp. 'monogermtubi']|nr:hypothetical protein LZ554_001976 [Drepanopeziza brunnea f. sp. 'monogermtubi']